VLETALIHRARLVGQERAGSRTAQGEFPTVLVTGPWIPARVMERGGVATKARGGQDSTEARVARSYELLLGASDEMGGPVALPTGSSVFETDCPILGSPTIPLDGDAELLNNGTDLIGFLCYGDVPLERS
jgi:hypothetical protein